MKLRFATIFSVCLVVFAAIGCVNAFKKGGACATGMRTATCGGGDAVVVFGGQKRLWFAYDPRWSKGIRAAVFGHSTSGMVNYVGYTPAGEPNDEREIPLSVLNVTNITGFFATMTLPPLDFEPLNFQSENFSSGAVPKRLYGLCRRDLVPTIDLQFFYSGTPPYDFWVLGRGTVPNDMTVYATPDYVPAIKTENETSIVFTSPVEPGLVVILSRNPANPTCQSNGMVTSAFFEDFPGYNYGVAQNLFTNYLF